MKNALSTWNPLRELEAFQSRILEAFNPVRGGQSLSSVAADWMPPVDIAEDEEGYLIVAELPEVTKEAVKVTVENGVLTITGERQLEKEENKRKYHRVERAYGIFARSFTLPADAEMEQLNAQFKDGVLRIRVPKSEKARPRQIEVKVD